MAKLLELYNPRYPYIDILLLFTLPYNLKGREKAYFFQVETPGAAA